MYDAFIVSYFTPELIRKAQALSGGVDRSVMVRTLIEQDLLFSVNQCGGLFENSLLMYRQPRRFTYPSGRPVKFVVTQQVRSLVELRCKYLGFRLTDYPIALIARAYHRTFGREDVPGPIPVGHKRTPRQAKGQQHGTPQHKPTGSG